MDETKRESTPQEREIDIMERYIEAQGPEQLLHEAEAALMDAALTLKCEEAEKDADDIRRYGLYTMSSESLARAALMLDMMSMAFEDAETRATFEANLLERIEFKALQKESAELFRRKQEAEPDEDQ
nr:MAG TPA: hypothetical protein [Caudoviricetes sp.]